jgi:hypothetical protein
MVGSLHVLQLLHKVQPLLHQLAGQLQHPAVLHPQPLNSKKSFLQVKAKLRRREEKGVELVEGELVISEKERLGRMLEKMGVFNILKGFCKIFS